MKKHLYLIGFMGTGKTTVARKILEAIGVDDVDMDAMLVEEEGMPITEIFAKHGEEYFRQKETALLKRITEFPPSLVSCGGGCAMRQENVDLMKESGLVVLLTADPETIYERVKDDDSRPLLNGHMNVEYIAELLEKRRPAYENAMDIAVETDFRQPEEIAAQIIMEYAKL